MKRILLILALAAAVMAPAATASPDTSATKQIAACLSKGGALKVKLDSAPGGTAFFSRPFTLMGRWMSWSYITSDGKVLGTMTAHGKLLPGERGTINRCLKPFNGHV